MDIGILDVVVLSLQRYHDQTPKEIRKNAELMANSPNSEISVLHYDFNVTAECLKQVQKIAVWGKVGNWKSLKKYVRWLQLWLRLLQFQHFLLYNAGTFHDEKSTKSLYCIPIYFIQQKPTT